MFSPTGVSTQTGPASNEALGEGRAVAGALAVAGVRPFAEPPEQAASSTAAAVREAQEAALIIRLTPRGPSLERSTPPGPPPSRRSRPPPAVPARDVPPP